MLNYHEVAKAWKRLSIDEDGVVSFEYVIVAACIVAVVVAAFGKDTTTGIGQVLNTAITAIGTAVTAAT